MEDAYCNPQAVKEKPDYRAQRLFAGFLAACMLLSIALYNGYPTIFSDTASYLTTGKFFVTFAPYRAPGYAIFTKLTGLGISARFIILTQAVMVVYVLRETCDCLIDDDRKFADFYFLASVCALAALTSLPWFVSLIMPDVFAGVLFLTAFLLAFADELRPARRIVLAAIFTISIAAHNSLFPIAALFVAAVFVLRHFNRSPRGFSSTRSVLIWLLVPMVVAGLGIATLNRQTGLGFRLSPAKNSFLMARLFGDGLAADFLRENCPQRQFVSCRYLSHLPGTEEGFLFQHPLYREIESNENEMAEIVRGTILAYPVRFATSSIKEIMLQFISLRTGDEIRNYGAREWNSRVILQVFPGDWQAFSNDKQNRDRLIRPAEACAKIDTTVFWISIAACLYFAGTGRFSRINLFFYSAIAYLLINASICATFAGVFDRYQSRVAWIPPLCLTAYIFCMARDWKRGGTMEEVEGLQAPVN